MTYQTGSGGAWRLRAEASEPTTGRSIGNLVVMPLAVIGVLAAFVCSALSTTIHYYDAMAVVAVAIGPVELVATVFFLQDHPLRLRRLVARFSESSVRQRINTAIMLPMILVGLPASLVLYANQALDPSRGVSQSLPVKEMFVRSGQSSTTYLAGVAPNVRLPPHLLPIYDTQPIDVGARLYARLSLGDHLAVKVHPGRFGFAWYERGVSKAY